MIQLKLNPDDIPEPTLPIADRTHYCRSCDWSGRRADHPTHDQGPGAIAEYQPYKPREATTD